MSPPVAVVTGAGSGIGRATSELLAQAGYRVALVGRRAPGLEQLRARLAAATQAGSEPLVLAGDLSDWALAERLIDQVAQAWGRLDALVNNAAVAEVAPLDRCAPEHVETVFRTNLLGPFALVCRGWPLLRAEGGGRVVNVSSMTAAHPQRGLAAYAASKAALESFTRSIAIEGASLGIEAYAVAPGAVETPMLRRLYSEAELAPERTLDPRAVAQVIVDCALGRRRADAGQVIELPQRGECS